MQQLQREWRQQELQRDQEQAGQNKTITGLERKLRAALLEVETQVHEVRANHRRHFQTMANTTTIVTTTDGLDRSPHTMPTLWR